MSVVIRVADGLIVLYRARAALLAWLLRSLKFDDDVAALRFTRRKQELSSNGWRRRGVLVAAIGPSLSRTSYVLLVLKLSWVLDTRRFMTSVLVLLGAVCRDALRTHAALHLELLALRHQLHVLERSRRPRVRLTQLDRLLWVWLSRKWRNWRTALVIVKPETVIAWHRQGFRLFWSWKSRRRTGRRGVPADIRALIRTISTANPLWGAPRIHGELLKLGIAVWQTSVAKYMVRHRRPPSQTWKTFLANHIAQIAATDFFVVPTATYRLLFVFVILAHHRRRIVHVAVTAHPTAAWTAQQLREAFPEDAAPRYLAHDRDLAFAALATTAIGMGIEEVYTAPHSPWQNAYAERVIGSIRRECLDHVIVINEVGLSRIVTQYLAYYHQSRTHLSLAKDSPQPRTIAPPSGGQIVATPQVGGLHHRYDRRAA
jgi:putative transposase